MVEFISMRCIRTCPASGVTARWSVLGHYLFLCMSGRCLIIGAEEVSLGLD